MMDTYKDDQSYIGEGGRRHEERDAQRRLCNGNEQSGNQPSATPEQFVDISSAEITIRMALYPTLPPVQIYSFVSGTQGFSTTVVVGAPQGRPFISSQQQQARSRSKSPPLPSPTQSAFSQYRSRSQTFAKRKPPSRNQFSYGHPAPIGLSTRTTRVSSMVLTDGMKSLTLDDYEEENMDYTWG